jgi:pimeloyl-ACP methyl ester carboxylesterase
MQRILAVLMVSLFATSVLTVAAQAPAPLMLPESSLPPQKTALVFGQKIAYYEAGAGPTIVLVHGFASQARFDWGNVILPLAEHHHVLALDQIGFGQSAKPHFDYSIQTYVDFLGEFLRVQNVTDFTLAGESLGGWISALYTIESLDAANSGPYTIPKPQRLILEDAAGLAALPSRPGGYPVTGTLADAHGVAIVFHDKSRVTEEFVRENFAMKLAADDGFTERSLWSNPKLAGEVVKDRLARITLPTLVVWGGSDELIPVEQGKTYAAGIPGAKLALIPECGHGPSIEKPKEFLAAVLPFIN